jgi:hypothetical protein
LNRLIRLCNTGFMTKHFRRASDFANQKTLCELTLRLGPQFRRAQEDVARALARAEEALEHSRNLLARCSPDVSTQG